MIRVIAGGKKSRGWVAEACAEYEKRLKKPYVLEWQFFDEARLSEKVMALGTEYFVVLLDEEGEMLSSVELARRFDDQLECNKKLALVVGGAFGHFDAAIKARADLIWSLSRLVFPHQFCRMIVAEQIYRVQEINAGRPYHHA